MTGTPASIPPSAPWLAHLRREAERFAEVLTQSPRQVHVPAYPDFAVYTLAVHIGRALRLFHGIIDTGSGEYPAAGVPGDQDVADWVRAAIDPLVTLLSEVPPDKPVPFPHQAGDRPAGLIAPLLAVEIGVHRWDVESVLGNHLPIPPDLAVQEVESVFANFVPGWPVAACPASVAASGCGPRIPRPPGAPG
ncbi:MAG: maleylpyruvate isomerase N-terminal domain-containing protein [Streptosporangiaceae bacterium]